MMARRMTGEEREEARMLKAHREQSEFTEEEFAAIKRRVREATVGPWDANGVMITSENDDQFLISVERHRGWEWDAEFIASARQDIPALIREVERLRELLAERRR